MKKLALIAAVLLLLGRGAPAAETNSGEAVVQSVREIVNVLAQYKLPFDPAEADRMAVDAVVKAADPFGRVLSADEAEALKERGEGLIYAADLALVLTNDRIVVARGGEGSAAGEAGLEEGDVLLALDGGSLARVGLTEVRELLRGAAADPVVLTVVRADGATQDVSVLRSRVQEDAVDTAEDWPADLCYLRLNGLYRMSGKDVVSDLRGWSEVGKGGIVIDLRGAGGADLTSAAEIAGLFAAPGDLLFAFRDGEDQDLGVYRASGGTPLDVPTMVVTDERTSGAAEVLAAALAGSGRGVMLVGASTAADPAVREVVSLPSGGLLYLVTKRLVVADGTVYNGRRGVAPDLVVDRSDYVPDYEAEEPRGPKAELSEEEVRNRQLREHVRGDPVLQRAVDILLGLKALNIRGTGRAKSPGR